MSLSLSGAAQNLILDIDALRVTAIPGDETWLVYDGDQEERRVNPRTRRALLERGTPLAATRDRGPGRRLAVDLTIFGAQVADDIKDRRGRGRPGQAHHNE